MYFDLVVMRLDLAVCLRCYLFLTFLLSVFSVPGVKVSVVQDTVETHLKQMILKHFDPKKADSIFTDGGVSSV